MRVRAPAEGRSRRPAVAASLAVLLLVVALVAAAVVARYAAVAGAGGDGVGDPYYPGAGGSGYDALAYDVTATFDPATGRLDATTTVTLVPTVELATVHLDLALPVSSVRLDGAELGFTQRGTDLAVAAPPRGALAPAFERGREVRLEVAYAGRPVDGRPGESGTVYTAGDETLIAGEPASAVVWYPSNEHPSDPARFAVTVTVPSGYEAISVGRLVSRTSGADGDTWRWQTDEPTATYATMLAVGQYEVVEEAVTVDGRRLQAVYAVSAGLGDTEAAMAWLRTSPGVAGTLTRWLGPYPVTSIGGVVPAVTPGWGGLETLGRPVYHRRVVGSTRLLQHELTHMWLGDTVTLQRWDDILINEGLTSYVERLAAETEGDETAQAWFDELYATRPEPFWRQRLSDPGSGEQLFTRVYDRGAMAVHALRVRMGDEAFFRFFRRWSQQQGPRSLEQWRRLAQEESPVDVRPLLAAWLDGTTKVPASLEHGFPG